jgi:tRNA-splicing endonuclease subunit Sen54
MVTAYSSDTVHPISSVLHRFSNRIAYLQSLYSFADSSPGIPRRGEKDFEPNPTELQADVLAASRGAMHNALSYPRLHGAKTRVIAFYAPDGYVPPAQPDRAKPKAGEDGKSSESTPKPARPLPSSARISPDACVYVPSPKGQFFKTMGQADSSSRVWLLPEEALYLIERGSLDIRWPSPSAGPGEEDLSVPMSLQAAYACFMGRGGLTLERYSVYTGLKRLGYALVRAPGWCDDIEPQDTDIPDASQAAPAKLHGPGLAGILGSLFNWIHDPLSTASTATGPIIGTGIHRHYSESHINPSAVIILALLIDILLSGCIPQARHYPLVRPSHRARKTPL